MVDTTAIAIAGIAASGGFGFATAWLTSRFARKRQDAQLAHERSASDLAELRAVLDEAAEVLRTAMWKSEAMAEHLHGLPSTRRMTLSAPWTAMSFRREAGGVQKEALEASRDAAVVGGKIELRLGRAHPVYTAYDEAMQAHTDTMERVVPLMNSEDWERDRAAQLQALDAVFEQGEMRFRKCRRAFIAACMAVVGSKLLD
jgi:hypothetical protein